MRMPSVARPRRERATGVGGATRRPSQRSGLTHRCGDPRAREMQLPTRARRVESNCLLPLSLAIASTATPRLSYRATCCSRPTVPTRPPAAFAARRAIPPLFRRPRPRLDNQLTSTQAPLIPNSRMQPSATSDAHPCLIPHTVLKGTPPKPSHTQIHFPSPPTRTPYPVPSFPFRRCRAARGRPSLVLGSIQARDRRRPHPKTLSVNRNLFLLVAHAEHAERGACARCWLSEAPIHLPS